ncbi:MAG TPA: flavin reductase family protein [Streptosporangiaceae bacterium]
MRSTASPRAGESGMRDFMNVFPSGVSVVAAYCPDTGPRGLTCSSLTSVTLSPPTIVVCIRTASRTLRAALVSGRFALNLLHERASRASALFASGAADRFDKIEWQLPAGACGPHLTADSHAIADCAVTDTVRVGDHTAVFAEVRRISLRNDAEPLLYGRRRYARWSDATSVPPPHAAR